MKYIVYNKSNGEVIKSGECPPALLVRQNGGDASLAVMEGAGNDIEHVVRQGKLELRPAGQIASRRAALSRAMEPANGPKGKLERVLAYLKKKGLDLGPDGSDL